MTMVEKTTITCVCDQCGKKRDTAINMLGIERIGRMDFCGYFELDGFDHLHFCNGACLEAWIKG